MPSSRVKFLMVFLVSAYKAAHKSELSDTADPKDAKKKNSQGPFLLTVNFLKQQAGTEENILLLSEVFHASDSSGLSCCFTCSNVYLHPTCL